MSDQQTNPFASPTAEGGAPLNRGVVVAAACPRCGNTAATPVRFTWWGGLLGPRLLHHVRCSQCYTAYNGVTGRYNTVGISIYSAVGFLIAIAVLLLLALAHG